MSCAINHTQADGPEELGGAPSCTGVNGLKAHVTQVQIEACLHVWSLAPLLPCLRRGKSSSGRSPTRPLVLERCTNPRHVPTRILIRRYEKTSSSWCGHGGRSGGQAADADDDDKARWRVDNLADAIAGHQMLDRRICSLPHRLNPAPVNLYLDHERYSIHVTSHRSSPRRVTHTDLIPGIRVLHPREEQPATLSATLSACLLLSVLIVLAPQPFQHSPSRRPGNIEIGQQPANLQRRRQILAIVQPLSGHRLSWPLPTTVPAQLLESHNGPARLSYSAVYIDYLTTLTT